MSMVTPTVINPLPIQGVDLSQFPGLIAALPDVQPFTLRSGYGYQEALNGIITFLQGPLNDWLNALGSQNDGIANALGLGLAAETASVAAQVQQILGQIVAGTQPQVNDATMNAALRSANSLALTYLRTQLASIAPAPSGGHDTAIETLALAAQATGSSLTIPAGTYLVNIATLQSFQQPVIRGAGENQTILKPFDPTKPVIRMQGGSGSISGGFVADLTISGPTSGTGSVGMELADCGGVTWDRVKITGALAEGIRFHVTQPAGFCEFNHGRADIDTYVTLPVHYMTDNNSEASFHGSGLDGGVINYGGPQAVLIDQWCFPYNAPMSATFFAHAFGTPAVITNNNSHRPGVTFFGCMKTEMNGSVAGDRASVGAIWFAGEFLSLGGPQDLGALILVNKVSYNGGNVAIARKPYAANVQCQSGATALNSGSATALMHVLVTAPNYVFQATLMVWQNPYNPGGDVDVLGSHLDVDNNGVGAPAFTYSNYQVVMTNSKYSSSFNAVVAVTEVGDVQFFQGLRQ